MSNQLTNRSVQVPLLRDAAIELAQRQGEAIVVSNLPVTEVNLVRLYFWLTRFGPRMNLDVWDETRGGAKVLNVNWGADGDIETVSFRRGDWEQALLKSARAGLH